MTEFAFSISRFGRLDEYADPRRYGPNQRYHTLLQNRHNLGGLHLRRSAPRGLPLNLFNSFRATTTADPPSPQLVQLTAKTKLTLQKDPQPLRIGILAAASINYVALIDPSQTHPAIVVSAIAARSLSKATAHIAKYDLTTTCKAYGSYETLLADGNIDAV
ncbi:hypothetical protein R6Q59_009986 [Mikania micrantha]